MHVPEKATSLKKQTKPKHSRNFPCTCCCASGAGGVNTGRSLTSHSMLLYIKEDGWNPAESRAHGPRGSMASPTITPSSLSTLASKRKTKKKHFVQQKVEVLRASDPVLSVLMWGVNHTVRACACVRAYVCLPIIAIIFFMLKKENNQHKRP